MLKKRRRRHACKAGHLIPSPYQQAIYDWIEHRTGNAVVDAVAGAGKTSPLLEGAKRLSPKAARRVFGCLPRTDKDRVNEGAWALQALQIYQLALTFSLGAWRQLEYTHNLTGTTL